MSTYVRHRKHPTSQTAYKLCRHSSSSSIYSADRYTDIKAEHASQAKTSCRKPRQSGISKTTERRKRHARLQHPTLKVMKRDRQYMCKKKVVQHEIVEKPVAGVASALTGRSKACQRTLFFLLVDCIHALLQMCSSRFRLPSRVALFLDRLNRVPGRVSLFSQIREFVLVRPSLLLPHLHIHFDFVSLSLEIHKGFFKSSSELFLSAQMFLDGSNAGFLVFGKLSMSKILACMTRTWRRRSIGCVAIDSTAIYRG